MPRLIVLLAFAAAAFAASCGDSRNTSTDSPDADAPSCAFYDDNDELEPPPLHTPRWAFEPWISKDISSASDTYDFVQGFLDRDIPVGAVVLDSPWETNYNTFIPNPDRYPAMDQLVADMHERGVRVVLWMTQMINVSSVDFEPAGDRYEGAASNFAQGKECDFFVNDGSTYIWWKGVGAGVDFFHPDAVSWWRRQQDALYDLGIDGWKLDFGEQYIPGPTVDTFAGPVTHQAYSEAYYRDFYTYGRHRRGREFVTMVRPWDESYGFEGRFYARPEHTPVGWVGDQRRDWIGLADALDHIFRSAQGGYAMIGSDIGGYLNFDDTNAGMQLPLDTLVFARWTAVAAFHPFFQLHGRANLAPWTVPDHVEETVELYRYYATLHHELVPFLYSLTEAAHAGGPVPIQPIGSVADWADDYRFTLGAAFLVAPILDASGTRDVELPPGTRWYDWWSGARYEGGQTLLAYDATDRARLPVFVRQGAIVPMNVSNAVTGLGTEASANALTVLVYPAAEASNFELHDSDEQLTRFEAATGRITMSRALVTTIVRVRIDDGARQVELNGAPVPILATRAAFDEAAAGALLDPAAQLMWIKVAAASDPQTITWVGN